MIKRIPHVLRIIAGTLAITTILSTYHSASAQDEPDAPKRIVDPGDDEAAAPDDGPGQAMDFQNFPQNANNDGQIINERIRLQNDALASRVQAAAEFLRAEGEYLNQVAQARVTTAEAVDKELDNWKKYVVVYFERREENLRSRMRRRDLYSMRQDQSLRLLDEGARRRYERMKRHPSRTSGASFDALNYLLDRFHGTPISYGIPIDQIFENNPKHTSWKLDDYMRSQLRVRTRPDAGRFREFALDQPTTIDLQWPGIFRHNSFDRLRNEIEEISQSLEKLTDAQKQDKAIEKLRSRFDALANQYFKTFGKMDSKGDTTLFIRMQRAEDFIGQKKGELSLMADNPRRAIRRAQNFVPAEDAKDAASLIAYMNHNGLKFTKPGPGDDAAYNSMYSMMLELYALFGEPIMDVPKVDLPERPSITEKDDDEEKLVDIKPLNELLGQ